MKISQNQMIYEHLRDIGPLTSLEAMREYGVMRLASRINDLKKMGVPIVTERVTSLNRYGAITAYTRYDLDPEADLPDLFIGTDEDDNPNDSREADPVEADIQTYVDEDPTDDGNHGKYIVPENHGTVTLDGPDAGIKYETWKDYKARKRKEFFNGIAED